MESEEITDAPYEAPTLEVVGTLEDLTKAGNSMNGDVDGGMNNAFPLVS
jgi:hypothetical protein